MSSLSGNIHFRCSFSLHSGQDPEYNAWGELIRTIRHSVSNTISNQDGPTDWDLSGARFYRGIELKMGKQYFLKTDRLIGDGTEYAPQYWALRLEHPDRDHAARLWRVDIGVTRRDTDHIDFSITVSHRMIDGYVGLPLPMPPYTRPWIVARLVRDNRWETLAGTHRLSETPIYIDPEGADEFTQTLCDPGRTCPMILLMPHYGELSLDASKLARSLVGSATVYVARADAYPVMKNLLPDTYFCYAGYVRVYNPKVDLDSDSDARRHRYFKREYIKEHGADTVHNIIIESLARRERFSSNPGIASIDDIHTKERELRLAKLRSEGAESREMVTLYEDEVQSLESEISRLKEEIESESLRIETELEESSQQLAEERYRIRQLTEETESLRAKQREQQYIAEFLNTFDKLPNSALDVVKCMKQLFPEKLVFTERACKSAEDVPSTMVGEVWRALWALASKLHPLYFSNITTIDIEKEFTQRTGIEFAVTEGEKTKDDARLMAFREDTFNGREINISPHLKLGNAKKKAYRIHFAVDRDTQRIIVGYIGAHLQTYSTRKM